MVGEVKFNVGMAEDAEMRDEITAWLCSLEVTFEVLSTADSGVRTGPLCNKNFDCIPDQKESYVRDVVWKLFVVEVSLLI